MSDKIKSWIPESSTALAAVARKMMKDAGPEEVFIFVAQLISSGKFGDAGVALAELSNVKHDGVELLLREPDPDTIPLQYVYESAGLPMNIYPLFITLLTVAQEVAKIRGDGAFGKKAQAMVMQKALDTPRIMELELPAAVDVRLRQIATAISEG